MLHCKFPDVAQVMRKTVVDGSNTSGFQRTALIGKDGYINTSFGKVGIESIILEEDSARRVDEDADSVTFRLDRLGIPLIEITTKPDIKTPEQAKETAEKIGSILRSTGKVMRGLGTIRQDLNISIKGHNRIELKGVQDLRSIPKIIEIEAERQNSTAKEESHVRNVMPDLITKYLRPMPGSARMNPETDLPLYEINKKFIKSLKIPELLEVKQKYQKLTKSELAKEIKKIKMENKDAHEGKLVGIAMGKLRGKAPADKIIEM